MVQVLICVDDSAASRKAVQFAGKILGNGAVGGLNVTLFHAAESLPDYVLSEQPAPGMTPRSIGAADAERALSQGKTLLEDQRAALVAAGLPAESVALKVTQIECLPEAKKISAALALIKEIQQGPYEIVCLGRRGASQLASSIIGSVAEKVIRECQGKTVWLVD